MLFSAKPCIRIRGSKFSAAALIFFKIKASPVTGGAFLIVAGFLSLVAGFGQLVPVRWWLAALDKRGSILDIYHFAQVQKVCSSSNIQRRVSRITP
jgi:hypothetical protein